MKISDEVREMVYDAIEETCKEVEMQNVLTILKIGGADKDVLEFTRKLIRHGCPPSAIIDTLAEYGEYDE